MNIVNPIWLSLIPAAGIALFFCYRHRGNAVRKIVSSTVILQHLKKSPQTSKLPYVPFRLLLELLLISLVVLMVAGVLFDKKNYNVLIAFDSSLSTYQQDQNQVRVIDKAKASLESYLDQFESSQVFSLLIADGSGIKPSLTKNQVISAISNDIHYQDDLDGSLSKALSNDFDEVFIASDKKITVKGYDKELIIPNLLNESLNNIFFSSVTVTEDSTRNSDQNVSVELESSKIIPSQVKLEVVDKNSKLLKQQNLEFGADKKARVKITIPKKELAGASLVLKSGNENMDSIKEDSVYVFDESKINNSKAVKITGANADSLNLSGVLQLTFLDSLDKNEPAVKGEIVFIDDKNTKIEEFLSKFKEDPVKNIFIQNVNTASSLSGLPTEWKKNSPLLTYVSFSNESKIQFNPIECPLWMSVDIKIGNKDAICSGNFSGKKIVYSGIKLLPFVKSTASLRTILLLNSFKWLFLEDSRNFQVLREESLLTPSSIQVDIQKKDISDSPAEPKQDFSYFLLSALILLLLIVDSVYWIKFKKVYGK